MTPDNRRSRTPHDSTRRTAAPGLIAVVRDEIRARHDARAARRALEADFASYTTRDELDELEAILDRSGTETADVADLRRLISRKRAA